MKRAPLNPISKKKCKQNMVEAQSRSHSLEICDLNCSKCENPKMMNVQFRKPINPISKRQAKRNAEFNKNVPPASKLGLTVCPECGSSDFRGIHRSHIVPRSLGGADDRENIEYKCAHCHFTQKHGIKEVK